MGKINWLPSRGAIKGAVLESRQLSCGALGAHRTYKAIPFTVAYSALSRPYWAPTAFLKPETGLRLQRTRSDGQAFKPERSSLRRTVYFLCLPPADPIRYTCSHATLRGPRPQK
jgi:hypothetical protein